MQQEIKKIFISYSWKPYSHKLKVVELAERLTNDGIHVILDDWDLKEGQDKYHFMEQMVNDESVNKVLLICNKEYTQKANKRKGGVGIESLIVSDEIYNQVEQTKFIPIVMEYENDKPCLPTFINSRIFIDLSNDEVFEEHYEKLIRNIFNKPISKRPPIGKMPVHLEDETPLFLPTAHKVTQIKNALINDNKNSLVFIKDYLETFIKSLLMFKLDIEKDEITATNFIEKVELSIEQMQPLKNDFIEFLNIISKYSEEDFGEIFLDFFEKLLQFYEDNEVKLTSNDNLQDIVDDNYRFFNYDLFISYVSIMLKNEKFKTLNFIYKNNFFVSKSHSPKPDILNFTIFRQYVYTLNEYKNQSINPKRISVVADLIKKYSTIIKFEDIIIADLLNHYMSLFYPSKSTNLYKTYWFPETSCYNSWNYELFPKIISFRYFEKIKLLFEVNDIQEFKNKILELSQTEKADRGFSGIPSLKEALNYENIATFN